LAKCNKDPATAVPIPLAADMADILLKVVSPWNPMLSTNFLLSSYSTAVTISMTLIAISVVISQGGND
jgi:hypothetical protein